MSPQPQVETLQKLVEEQAMELARREQCITDLNNLLRTKDLECEELARQNQKLFEDLEETRNNYEMVSEFYDKACQDAGATKKALKAQQKHQDRQVPAKILECYPVLANAEHWLRSHTSSSIPLGTRLEIPVLCLRWTHATINRKMI